MFKYDYCTYENEISKVVANGTKNWSYVQICNMLSCSHHEMVRAEGYNIHIGHAIY